MLQLKALTKAYGPSVVLSGFTERFEAGRIYGLIGANGAGKSTLIKLVSGVVRPTSGSIALDGTEVEFASPRDAYDLGIRTLQQETDNNLYTSLSVIENIVLRTKARSGAQRLIRAGDRIDARRRLGVIGAERTPLDRRLSDLPLAHRQEIALACALDDEARLLILDEPTASLDAADVGRLMAAIRAIRDRGASVIYVSHHLDEVVDLVDTVIVLRGGATVDRFDIDEEGRRTGAAKERIITGMLGRPAAEIVTRPAGMPTPKAVDDDVLLRLSDIVSPTLGGVSLSAQAGEIVVLTGLVGSGCDDLLRIAYGLERPVSGSIKILGKRLGRNSPRKAIVSGAGFVPSDRARLGLHLNERISWNATLPILRQLSAALGLLGGRRIAENAAAARRRLQIVAREDDPFARSLSGGNQQKVVLAKCLASDPKLVLLVEPTRGVDVGTRAQIYEILRGLAAKGAAVVCATYDFDEAALLGDRIVVLRRGRIAEELTGGGVTELDVARAAMGGSDVQRKH